MMGHFDQFVFPQSFFGFFIKNGGVLLFRLLYYYYGILPVLFDYYGIGNVLLDVVKSFF